MGTVVVVIGELHNKVAAIRAWDGRDGYLLVQLVGGMWSDGSDVPGVDLRLALEIGDGGWDYSDRADPDDWDAKVELQTGVIDWYGKEIRILRWLDGEQLELVKTTIFRWWV